MPCFCSHRKFSLCMRCRQFFRLSHYMCGVPPCSLILLSRCAPFQHYGSFSFQVVHSHTYKDIILRDCRLEGVLCTYEGAVNPSTTKLYLPVVKTLSTKTWLMSRKAFFGDTLKYRKPRSRLNLKTTLQVRYSITSRFSISHRLIKASRDVCHAIFYNI